MVYFFVKRCKVEMYIIYVCMYISIWNRTETPLKGNHGGHRIGRRGSTSLSRGGVRRRIKRCKGNCVHKCALWWEGQGLGRGGTRKGRDQGGQGLGRVGTREGRNTCKSLLFSPSKAGRNKNLAFYEWNVDEL